MSISPINGLTGAHTVEHLARHDIDGSERGGSIRIAPHFFNNFADIEKLGASLP